MEAKPVVLTKKQRNDRLLDAVFKNDLKAALTWLKRGADVNAISDHAVYTPLSAAAYGGKRALVDALLAQGANVNVAKDVDYHPLSAAIEKKHEDIARLLIEKGADINTGENPQRGRPLSEATANGWESLARLLLDKGASVNWTSMDGETAFSIAAKTGNVPIMELLVAHGAKIDADPHILQNTIMCGSVPALDFLLKHGLVLTSERPRFGQSYVHIAAQNHNPAMLERILQETHADINGRDDWGRTPLHIAAAYFCADTVKALIAQKADLNALDQRFQSILDTAKETETSEEGDQDQGKDATIAVLEKAGAKAAPPSLSHAVAQGNIEELKRLLQAKANPNDADVFGTVPLYYTLNYSASNAYESDDESKANNIAQGMADLLLAKGANPNAKAPDGRPLIETARQTGRNDLLLHLYRAGAEAPSLQLIDAVASHDKAVIDELLEKGVVPESTTLLYAMQQNDMPLLLRLLEKGARVNSPFLLEKEDAETVPDYPLHVAVEKGDLASVKALLEHGADPNIHQKSGYAALYYVGFSNRDEENIDAMVRLLVEHGAAVRKYPFGPVNMSTPLTALVRFASARTIAYLLDKGALADINTPWISYEMESGSVTPLAIAAERGDSRLVRLLLEQGADPNYLHSEEDLSPLATAAFGSDDSDKSLAVVQVLLDYGALPKIKNQPSDKTPLFAAKTQRNKRTQTLLQSAINSKAPANPALAMHHALANGDNRTAIQLIDQGFPPDSILPGGMPTLYAAAARGNSAVVRALIAKGADVNKSWRLGTPLHAAAENGEYDIVKLLLTSKAAIDADDGCIGTPLVRAARAGAIGCVRLLLESGASPDAARPEYPGPALYYLSAERDLYKYIDVGVFHNTVGMGNVMESLSRSYYVYDPIQWEQLRQAGMDINTANPVGRTFLMEAVIAGNEQLVRWLLDRGADISRKDKKGNTALSEALSRGNYECAELLQKAGAK